MDKKYVWIIILILVGLMLLVIVPAAGLFLWFYPIRQETGTGGQTSDISALQTQVAEDFILGLTLTAISEPPTEMASPTAEPPTATQVPPTATPTPTPTDEPTEVPEVFPTYIPTDTPVPKPCNWGRFVKDVTIPDNTIMMPGEEFIKTWRIENVGTCNWTPDYELVFVDGSRMGGNRVVSLPDFVLPGETIDVSVRLTAPDSGGSYRGNWTLQDDDGDTFGFGPSYSSPIWVLIRVIEENEDYVYDFVGNLCMADWESGKGNLPCPGNEGSDRGFVIILDNPHLENRFEDEPAIWSVPDRADDGFISGEYPEIRVRDGYHFKTWVGCLDDSKGCNVIFSLDYRVDGGRLQHLGSWHEVYDNLIKEVDLDLSDLAGEDVSFILTVEVEKNPDKANPFWFVPRIEDEG